MFCRLSPASDLALLWESHNPSTSGNQIQKTHVMIKAIWHAMLVNNCIQRLVFCFSGRETIGWFAGWWNQHSCQAAKSQKLTCAQFFPYYFAPQKTSALPFLKVGKTVQNLSGTHSQPLNWSGWGCDWNMVPLNVYFKWHGLQTLQQWNCLNPFVCARVKHFSNFVSCSIIRQFRSVIVATRQNLADSFYTFKSH